MKLLVMAACVAAGLSAAELKIDHATVCGANLEAMRSALSGALPGVQPEYGGPHSNHATEMALVSFPDGSYLELMGIQKNADPAAVDKHEWSRFLRNNAGPCAFAIHVTDIEREVKELNSAGIMAGEPESAGRTRPDGVKLAWKTASVGPGARGSLFPFLIADQTPRELRAYPSGKPTTDQFSGIVRVVVGVRDMARAIAGYRAAFHLAAPKLERDTTFGAELAWFEGTPIMLTQGTHSDNPGDAPVAFVLANGKGSGHAIHWLVVKNLGWRLGILD